MIIRRKNLKNARSIDLLARFRSEEDGIAAIEGAVVIAMLSAAFIGMADLSVEAHTQNRLANALRASVQYIANEGRDLDDAEQLFKDSYGSDSVRFSTALKCSCAKSRTEYRVEDGTQETTGEEAPVIDKLKVENVTVETAQNKDGSWAECTTTCVSGPVVKYLEMKGSSTVRNLVKNEEVSIDVKYSVRVE